jgi:NitT/TauT family transport system substrate-binding protein
MRSNIKIEHFQRGTGAENALVTRRNLLAGAAALAISPARAEATTLRLSHGYSIGYLPMMIMRERGLIEKHAALLGLPAIKTAWQVLDGGNNINDAVLAGALDIAGIGIPAYLVLRDRTLGKRQEVTSIGALQAGALWLNTADPRIRTLADYGPGDKIAVPGIKTSYAAVVLEMAAAKAFGIENYARLDPLTVGLPHPDAYAAMVSGQAQVRSHFASPPFSYQELRNPAIHRVLSTSEVFGALTILVTLTQRAFAESNPGLMRAFLAAQQEADALITADRSAAIEAYGKGTGLKTPAADLREILADPENTYGPAPKGSLIYASFLAQAGVLKAKPATWQELFLPAIHTLDGS